MHQEEQRTVANPRQARAEAAVEALQLVLVFDGLLYLLPVHAERRVGEHVVEALRAELVLGQRVPELDAADVLALDEHVALADRVALGVQLLPEGAHHGAGVQLVDVLHAAGEEAAGARCRVVDGADDPVAGQGFAILHEDQGRRKAHDVTGREVLARGVVGTLGEAPDQLFEHQAHLVVADDVEAEIGGRNLLDDLEQEVGLGELPHELVEAKVREDLARVLGEAVHIVQQVALQVRATEPRQVQGRRVVEGLSRSLQQELLPGLILQAVHGLELLDLGQDLLLGAFQDALKPAKQSEGKDDSAVLGLAEVAAQEVGKVPDVGGRLGEVSAHRVVKRLRSGPRK